MQHASISWGSEVLPRQVSRDFGACRQNVNRAMDKYISILNKNTSRRKSFDINPPPCIGHKLPRHHWLPAFGDYAIKTTYKTRSNSRKGGLRLILGGSQVDGSLHCHAQGYIPSWKTNSTSLSGREPGWRFATQSNKKRIMPFQTGARLTVYCPLTKHKTTSPHKGRIPLRIIYIYI